MKIKLFRKKDKKPEEQTEKIYNQTYGDTYRVQYLKQQFINQNPNIEELIADEEESIRNLKNIKNKYIKVNLKKRTITIEGLKYPILTAADLLEAESTEEFDNIIDIQNKVTQHLNEVTQHLNEVTQHLNEVSEQMRIDTVNIQIEALNEQKKQMDFLAACGLYMFFK